jgi:UDP-N-acetylglucosamine acyltransferase
MISPLASINTNAKIGSNVTIEPFSSISGDVEIEEGTWIGSNVTIYDGARIGKNCKIYPGAVISANPQDLKYNGEHTITSIGDNTTIRECVTINKGTSAAGKTQIANSVNLAGHVLIDDYAILEGYVGVSQFMHIGAHSFIAGQTGVRKDVPPFVKAAREPLTYVGINSVGLRRRGYTADEVQQVQDIYRIIYQHGYAINKALDLVEEKIAPSDLRDLILNFIKSSEKGVIKGFSSVITEE